MFQAAARLLFQPARQMLSTLYRSGPFGAKSARLAAEERLLSLNPEFRG